MEKKIEECLKLKDGERYIVPESDYGKAEIWRINDHFFLFGIPYFGGKPFYCDRYHINDLEKMIFIINQWG